MCAHSLLMFITGYLTKNNRKHNKAGCLGDTRAMLRQVREREVGREGGVREEADGDRDASTPDKE